MIEKKVAVLGIIVIALVIALVALPLLYYTPAIDNLNLEVNTQQDQMDSKDAQISTLNSQIATLNSQIDSLQTSKNAEISELQASKNAEISELQIQITDLQSQLLSATDLIAQLQGPTGILPTFMDIGWVGQDLNNGNYFLQLSLKNTGPIPITQIFVTLNSVQIPMTFTYLNTTVNVDSPLPSYETAIGLQDVTPPVLNTDTFPLVIQAIANNGTIYTYQTTITSHI